MGRGIRGLRLRNSRAGLPGLPNSTVLEQWCGSVVRDADARTARTASEHTSASHVRPCVTRPSGVTRIIVRLSEPVSTVVLGYATPNVETPRHVR